MQLYLYLFYIKFSLEEISICKEHILFSLECFLGNKPLELILIYLLVQEQDSEVWPHGAQSPSPYAVFVSTLHY